MKEPKHWHIDSAAGDMHWRHVLCPSKVSEDPHFEPVANTTRDPLEVTCLDCQDKLLVDYSNQISEQQTEKLRKHWGKA